VASQTLLEAVMPMDRTGYVLLSIHERDARAPEGNQMIDRQLHAAMEVGVCRPRWGPDTSS
jgi:hypothetical protein